MLLKVSVPERGECREAADSREHASSSKDQDIIGEQWKLKVHQYVSFSIAMAGTASYLLRYFEKGVDCSFSLALSVGGLIWLVLVRIKLSQLNG